MLSRDKLKASSLSTPVPLDMINAWLRGEYLIGQNESSGYELLGWTLMLRGLYVYGVIFDDSTDASTIEKLSGSSLPNDVSKKMAAWGICKIDVDEGDITFHGIRLGLLKEPTKSTAQAGETTQTEEAPQNSIRKDNFESARKPTETTAKTGEAAQSGEAAQNSIHLVWYSIFSKLTRVPASSIPDMYFGYVLFPIGEKEKVNFQWYSTMTAEQLPKPNSNWQGFELPLTSNKEGTSLGWAKMYPPDFRKKLCEYLLDIESDIDRPSLSGRDTVSAIGHLPLEKWKPPIRLGLLQPTVGPGNPISHFPLKCATILFFPLMAETLGSREKANQK